MCVKELLREISIDKVLKNKLPKDIERFLKDFDNLLIHKDKECDIYYFIGDSGIEIEYEVKANILWYYTENSSRLTESYELNRHEFSELVKYAMGSNLHKIGLSTQDLDGLLVLP